MSKSPDIVFVRPWAQTAVPANAVVQDSLGVGYLTSVLREVGYDVVILDAFTFGFGVEEIKRCISQFAPKILGLSFHSFADYRQCVEISRSISQMSPRIYCIWGGEFVTFNAIKIMEKHPYVDAVILGEGEQTIKEVVSILLTGKPGKEIPGAVMRDIDGKIVPGGLRSAIGNMDSITSPAKDIVNTAIKMGREVALSMLTGRGCTNSCTFCTANKFMRLGGGRVWRRHSPKRVVDEIESLVKTYGNMECVQPIIQFQDVIFLGTSNAAKKWVSLFLDEIELRNVKAKYYFMGRSDAIIANRDLLPRLVDAGLRSVEVGIESGIPRMLELYSKANSIEQNNEAIKILKENGIGYDASGFIMFDPRMTLEELRINGEYLRQIGHANWDRYSTRLQVFPGTKIREQLIHMNLYNEDAELDDVYAYQFMDARVAEVCSHTWIYDMEVYELDKLIRTAKSVIASEKRNKFLKTESLKNVIENVQRFYNEYFALVINGVEKDQLKSQFEQLIRKFLTHVRIYTGVLKKLLYQSG